MFFSKVSSISLAALTAIASASPFNGLHPRDLKAKSCGAFVYGATDQQIAGTVSESCVEISPTHITVSYPSLPAPGFYTDVHVAIDTVPITQTAFGQWEFSNTRPTGSPACTINAGQASCNIPLKEAWKVCGLKLYIGIHGSFSLDGKLDPITGKPTAGNTGFRQGTKYGQVNRGNPPRYFEFLTECKCPVVTTYPPYTTSLVYEKTITIVETNTVTCSTTPPAATAETTCTYAYAAPTLTVEGMTQVTDFVCTKPE